MWSLSVRTAVKVNGVPYDRPANPYHAENDSLILGTDTIPSPGLSRVSTSPPLSRLYSLRGSGAVWHMQSQGGHHDHHPRPGRHCRCLIILPRHCYPTCAIKRYPRTRTRCVLHKPITHPSLQVLMTFVRQMARRGRLLKTWKVIINGQRSNTVPFATHSFSSCARMIPLAYLLESLSVEK